MSVFLSNSLNYFVLNVRRLTFNNYVWVAPSVKHVRSIQYIQVRPSSNLVAVNTACTPVHVRRPLCEGVQRNNV